MLTVESLERVLLRTCAPNENGNRGGALLLDRIEAAGATVQETLLRVLETGVTSDVNDVLPSPVNVRWIAAAEGALEPLVAAGKFHHALASRLGVHSIAVPPLRERKEDIPQLFHAFLAMHAALMGRSTPAVSEEAGDLFLRYRWPANDRELENVAECAMLLCDCDEIRAEHLPFQLRSDVLMARLALREVERQHIQRVIKDGGGNLSRAARILGIDRTTLYNKLKKYELR